MAAGSAMEAGRAYVSSIGEGFLTICGVQFPIPLATPLDLQLATALTLTRTTLLGPSRDLASVTLI
jgi:hypothetical protein